MFFFFSDTQGKTVATLMLIVTHFRPEPYLVFAYKPLFAASYHWQSVQRSLNREWVSARIPYILCGTFYVYTFFEHVDFLEWWFCFVFSYGKLFSLHLCTLYWRWLKVFTVFVPPNTFHISHFTALGFLWSCNPSLDDKAENAKVPKWRTSQNKFQQPC